MTTVPYGAWISPEGELIVVGEESHYEKAIEILDDMGLLKDRFIARLCDFNSRYDWRHVYRIMLFLGYCRVVFCADSLEPDSVEVSRAHIKRHKDWIKAASFVEYEPHFAKRRV